MSRILALDYGKKRVGVASTDPLQIIASPLQTVETPLIVKFLRNYMASEEVVTIVIGWPLDLKNEETDSTPEVRRFSKKLEELFPHLEIVKHDERFTSKMAVRSMVASGMKKSQRKQKENVDKISASLILQSYLESR
jgi:putative Holliday junction resolvase